VSNPEPGNPAHKLAVGIGCLLALLLVTCDRAHASELKPWVFEFEFAAGLPSMDKLLKPDFCSKVIPAEHAKKYLDLGKPAGLEISCGNNQPMYLHFLGRRCWKPLPNFQMDCGWRHFSSPSDGNEITFDAFSVKGAFRFGGKR